LSKFKISPAERIMRKVEILPGGCWRFSGKLGPRGYATIWTGTGYARFHRFAFEVFRDPIPDGAILDHLCHDPKECKGGSSCPHRACGNPWHLEISNLQKNGSRERKNPPPAWVIAMATTAAALANKKTHCKAGHELTEGNCYRWRGHRRCLTCYRQKAKEYQAAKRALLPRKRDPSKCRRGHPFTAENTIIECGKIRRCRICAIARREAFYARRRS
jgi:hypothetical protein